MSWAQRKGIAAHGISVFLNNQGYSVDFTNKGHKVNKILVEFLKMKGLPYHKWNWKYKGCNTATLINAEAIQENWREFREWIIENKPGM